MASEKRRFVLLLRDPDAAVAAEWMKRRLPSDEQNVVGPPPATGLDFFTCEADLARRTDAWWAEVVGARRAVVLVVDEPGLVDWLRSQVEADFVVAVAGPSEASIYGGLDHVVAVVTDDPRLLVDEALRRYDPAGPREALWQRATAPPPPPIDHREMYPHALRQRQYPPAARPPRAVPGVRGTVHPRRGSGLDILDGVITRLSGGAVRQPVSSDLGGALLSFRPPICVSVASRKGGVGKTAVAAALAAIFGEALAPWRANACLVDANINNPDAWGRLRPEGTAATFRVLVDHLGAGVEPPPPASARTPGLAMYPESREGDDGYSPAQIGAAAGYLRTRHAALVVDLPNRLPGFNSAEAAIAASWIAASNVVVLPTTADPAALTGVLEYLATENLRIKPVVVPYIVPRVRQVRNATEIRSLVEEIRVRSSALVELPDDDRATLAHVRGLAITEISPPLYQAYLRVAESVAGAASSVWPASRPAPQ